jgi:hypothetical protein
MSGNICPAFLGAFWAISWRGDLMRFTIIGAQSISVTAGRSGR